ncbi:TolC family protein [Frigoriflavimonas asaccharolytica]|uniref:Outer membrane protein n=1 Tax=Frigoriflavimonas asaccharolytica TaxID=2735899 RepID=A0A8J8K6L4_9FLAO|nr:TolC family protein [Frigoriflavimonas asaccharolytica]NRS91083.1 outer membrane protein [Frigoriflavimonas asaccharolytica]
MKKLLILLSGFLLIQIQAQKQWTLREAVDYAVQNNLQIISSQYNTKTQQNNLEIAKREYLPSVVGNFNTNSSFGQGLDVFGTARRNDNFSNNANIGANMLLFNYGRLDKTIKRSNFDLQANEQDLEQIKNDISLQVAQQYLQILLNKEIQIIANSALDNAQKQYNRAKITTTVGTTARTILAEAEATVAREKQNVTNAKINTDRSIFTLAQLLRLEDYKTFDVVAVQVDSEITPPLQSAEDILETVFAFQPVLKAAEYRIHAAEAQTEITKTAFWPSISATAGFGTNYFNSLTTNFGGVDAFGNGTSERGFFTQYKDNFGQQVGLTASIPIFNKGITRLQVQQSKINEDVAKNNLEIQKQTVLQNVQRAQFDAESNYQNYTTALEVENSSRLSLDFAEKSYAAGRSTIYEVNIARNNLANAQGSVAQTKYNYLFSLKLMNFYAGIPFSL